MRNITTLWHAALILSLGGGLCTLAPNMAIAQRPGTQRPATPRARIEEPPALGSAATPRIGSTAGVPSANVVRASWTNLPGVDGKKHSLSDLAVKDVVIVAITCNHCPIAIEYYDRMKEFVKQRCGPETKVTLVAISVSDAETDKLPRMKEMSDRRRFNFPYLYDESQRTAKQLGAIVTPQFFVLNKERTVVYRGAWDDNVNASQVKTRYVEEAVNAVLAGRTPATFEVKARGCLIDYIDSK